MLKEFHILGSSWVIWQIVGRFLQDYTTIDDNLCHDNEEEAGVIKQPVSEEGRTVAYEAGQPALLQTRQFSQHPLSNHLARIVSSQGGQAQGSTQGRQQGRERREGLGRGMLVVPQHWKGGSVPAA